MNTTTSPRTTPRLESRPLTSVGDLGQRLAGLHAELGPDLDLDEIVQDVESLDTWLLALPGDPMRFVGRTGDALIGARYATCTLMRLLGCPVPPVYEPRDKPTLAPKRRLADIEVLTYRYVAVSHSPRATVILGALEQQATGTELAQLTPDQAEETAEGRVALRLPGSRSKRPGRRLLPAWTAPAASPILARDAPWLLTDSKSASTDGRNSAILTWTASLLEQAMGWTRPSAKGIALTALQRVGEARSPDAAHRLSRNKNRDVTADELQS